MTTDTFDAPAGRLRGERATSVAWGWPFTLGLLLLLLGLFAILAWAATSIASIVVLGVLLVISAVVQIVEAFHERGTGGAIRHVLGSVLALVVGGLLLWRPLVGLATVALLLGAFFLVNGLFRVLTGLVDRYPGWGWDVFYGLAALALGIITLAYWPRISLWLVGTLVGIEIALRGIVLMTVALALRRELRRGRPAAPTAAPTPPRAPTTGPVAPAEA